MEAAAPTDTAATAATTASQRLIGNQGCTNQHNGCQNNESITKHGMILLMIGVPRILAARFDPELGAALAFITIAGAHSRQHLLALPDPGLDLDQSYLPI